MAQTGAALYRATHQLTTAFSGLAWASFQIGDAFQRKVLDAAFDLASFRLSGPGRLASALAGQATEIASLLPLARPRRRPLSELQANFRVFQLVQDGTPVPAGTGFPIAKMLDDVYQRFDYRVLWVVEGMGHDYAEFTWKHSDRPPRGLLKDPSLPAKSLTMLHAGMGLYLANEALRDLTPFTGPTKFFEAVGSFVEQCEANSKPGYTGAALESLGLVTRTWYPEIVAPVAGALPAAARGYFWHGAGRALYFLPVHALPGILSSWTAARSEGVDATSALNLKAGLAWATILVNLHQPAIIENLLARRGGEFTGDGGFRNGVESALVMASDTAPGDATIAALSARTPPAHLRQYWEVLVRQPAAGVPARREYLAGAGRLEDVFRYQFAWDAAPDSRSDRGRAA